MNIKFFDSHAHYFDRRFETEGENADRILREEVFSKNVSCVINVATNADTAILCIEQAKRYDGMYVAVGLHPEDIAYCKRTIEDELEIIKKIIGDEKERVEKKIVALGEIGLDYHYEGFDKLLQAKCFDAQMEMARELKLPVIIHDREAHGDSFETVLRHKEVRGVFHSYSGSAEMAAELIKRGWYISFSGVVTFKNASRVREVVASIPLDRILIETDCPYLAPHPYRGKLNHSGLLEYTAMAIAEIKGIDLEKIAEITTKNTKELFSIK